VKILKLSTISLIVFLLTACQEDAGLEPKMFVLKDNEAIGVDFSNDLESTNEFNVYKYRNFYNGGGVGLGDINNDGLVDMYFVSNQKSNKLYLNKGNFSFEDITDSAGVGGTKAWSTGVTFADVNGDGYLDIYVCNSGDLAGDDKKSELFINQQDNTFTEEAEKYGLNDEGYSTHASFFDYDKDGDLDVYLLNNSYAAIGSFNLRKNQRPVRDKLGGDKLMRNDGGKFVDVSDEAGIYGSEIGFGLGVTVGDYNNDTWLDLFISNDFFERDYLYLNQRDGTFKEDLTTKMHSTSAASMGADAADINNDGYTDIFVTDMLPYDYERLKTVTTFDDWNRYKYNVSNDYHHQFTRNVLHLNHEGKYFSEISRYMGVHASDWSWGALFFDMDNDGWRDLFIANGIYKDITNQDYLEYIANESIIESIVTDEGVNYKELIDVIPSNKVPNMAFMNLEGEDFKLDDNLGLNKASFSNGAAYGDLDNDGDLDLVVNNINEACYIYENVADNNNKSLRLRLKGSGKNTFAIGAKVIVECGDKVYTYENITCKGFQSTVDNRMTIGIGKATEAKVKVQWPNGKESQLTVTDFESELVIDEADAKLQVIYKADETKESNPFKSRAKLDYVKLERDFSDFNQERLIFSMRNNEGGQLSIGDIDKDGNNDLVLPGAKGQANSVFLGAKNGSFKKSTGHDFDSQSEPEHRQTSLVDIDGDNDLDLVLAAGGVEHSKYSPFLVDKIYLNNGEGSFTKSDGQLSAFPKVSSSCVEPIDYDGDGDNDLIISERVKIAQCGMPCSTYLLENDGAGNFKDVSESIAPSLKDIGMVTAVEQGDFDGDGDLDVLLAGEFMALTLLENVNGKLEKKRLGAEIGVNGIWSALHVTDIDKDGDLDIIAGNHGENSRFTASQERPTKLYFDDFDGNGFGEGILCYKRDDGEYYPYALRHDLIDQMKSLKKVFPDFESFKSVSIDEIIPKEKLTKAVTYDVDNLKTVLLINKGGLKFENHPLPKEAQFTNIYAIADADFDHDGDLDIVMGGNLYGVQPDMGIYDASRGLYLENKGNLNFEPRMNFLDIQGEVRDMKVDGNRLYVNIVNDSLQILTF